MKKNEFVQIKGSDLKELILKAKALGVEIADLTMDKNMKKLKDLKTVSKKKKDRAQILTVIRQKELLVKLESRVKSLESREETQGETRVKNQESREKTAVKSKRKGGKS